MPTCQDCAPSDAAKSGIATRDRPLTVPTSRPSPSRLASGGDPAAGLPAVSGGRTLRFAVG